MLPDLLHVVCGADCQLLNSLFQIFAADAESAERSQSVVFVCSGQQVIWCNVPILSSEDWTTAG